MKGLVIPKIGSLSLTDDIPEPVMGPYDALVEVLACGICNGTDLKVIDGHFKGFNTYPCVLGHEGCGRVVAVGEKVRNYKLGDIVLRAKLRDTERYYSGWGSFAERALVSDYWAMVADGCRDVPVKHTAEQVIPPDINPVKGQMIITLKEVYSALLRFGVSAGKKVMINGCGPVGQAMTVFCKLLGVSDLMVSDMDAARLEKAGRLGADILVNPASESVEEAVKRRFPNGVDIFIDAGGKNELINLGLRVIGFNGKVAVYGISPVTHAAFDWENAPYNWNVQFVQKPTFPEEAAVHSQVVEFVRRGAIDLDDFVTHIMPVEEYERGFDLVSRREAGKISLTF